MSKQYLIALDDGHGMNTPGKRTPTYPDGHFMHENEFNHVVVDYLSTILEACGFKTLLTAPTDADTALRARTNTANQAKADYFISIHANAYKGEWGDQQGTEVFYYPTSTEGKQLAIHVLEELIKGTPQKSRGIKTATFSVLKYSHMPAILIEAGFMDNPREAELLQSDEFRKEVAEEVAKGLCTYLGVQYKEGVLRPSTPQVLYKVQVGAFSKKANAEALKTKLATLGYASFITYVRDLYKVQVGAYKQKENADALSKELRAAGFTPYVISVKID